MREPRKEEDRTQCGWENSRLGKAKLPLVGKASREPKLLAKWLVMVFVGWCRMELGVKDCRNLRVPIDPVVGLAQYISQGKSKKLSNQKYDSSGWSDEDAEEDWRVLEKDKNKKN